MATEFTLRVEASGEVTRAPRVDAAEEPAETTCPEDGEESS